MRRILELSRHTFVLCGTLVCLVSAPGTAAPSETGGYLCWALEDAIQDLRSQGLKVIYSSERVRPGMQITEPPTGHTLREQLVGILEPFGLSAKEGSDGVLLIVGDGPQETVSRPDGVATDGVLPLWARRSEVAELTFPELTDAPDQVVHASTRFLTVRLTAVEFRDWTAAAFELKNLIVAARSTGSNLEVAVDGPKSTVARLVTEGLAQYVDAYLYHDEPTVPLTDPTARSWKRVEGDEGSVLEALLLAGQRGDELVVFDDARLDPLHEVFLNAIQATASADLHVQPPIQGIEASAARFFLHPSTGNHYLALYADGPTELSFGLPSLQEAQLIFPRDEEFEFASSAVGSSLAVGGEYPYYLFELRLFGPEAEATEFEVTTDLFVDPYEEVVKNQVFQERQDERFESLDVMEYINTVGQYAGGVRTQWEHRIIQRKGRYTDYHHLGYSINGAPYPRKKLLKGRLYRNEALLRLRPLEVELDQTYHYEYLGEEIVNGRPTYKIGYKPRNDTPGPGGSYVSGVLWLDQKTNAHHRVRTVQRGTQDGVISDEGIYHYQWIPSGGQCWWDWTRRDGSASFSSSGAIYGNESVTTRQDFEFNRPDIEQVVAEAYASDVMIHVETPPDGHRWLVKDKKKGRRLGGLTEISEAERQQLASTSLAAVGEVTPVAPPTSDADYGPRTLADVHAYSTHSSFSIFGIEDGSESFDFYPGVVVSSQDLWRTGASGYVGFFLDDARVGLGVPNFLHDSWSLSVDLYLPYESKLRRSTSYVGGERLDGTVDLDEQTLSLSLGLPLTRRTAFAFTYSLTRLDFERAESSSPRFVLPQDTMEHSFDVGLAVRWSHYTAEVGLEHGLRQEWEPWGIDGAAETTDEFEVFRSSIGGFWKVGKSDNLSLALAYWQGEQLDRFSRRRNGQSRVGIAGFGNLQGYDGAVAVSATWGTHLWKVPINLRVTKSSEWLDSWDFSDERTWVRFRFLVNGPFKLDIWPSVSYVLESNIPGEVGDTVLSFSLSRRQ